MILCTIGASASWAQSHPIPLPLPAGAVVVQTLSFTGGERESFMSLDEVSDKGFRYGWQLREVKESGDTIQRAVRIPRGRLGPPRCDPSLGLPLGGGPG